MEKTELVNISSIDISNIMNIQYVGNAFENSNGDYIIVNEGDKKVGYYNLEDFCNKSISDTVFTRDIMDDEVSMDNNEENRLLQRICSLDQNIIKKIHDFFQVNNAKNYVWCCRNKEYCKKILNNFQLDCAQINIVTSIFELNKGDNVVFLTYKQLKLYRKVHINEIKGFIALNNLVSNYINEQTFENSFVELQAYFEKINVGFIYGIIPENDYLDCLTEDAIARIKGFGPIDYDFYAEILGGVHSSDFVACMEQHSLSRVIDNGIFKRLEDCKSSYYNVECGMRITTAQPKEYENTIYIFGPCIVRGVLVSDHNTIPSMIQRMINDNSNKYCVVNCGVGGGSNLENTYKYILSLPIKTGDIVILIEEGLFLENKINTYDFLVDLSKEFNRVKLHAEWFLDRPAHCNKYANEIIAKAIYQKLLIWINHRPKLSKLSTMRLYEGKEKIFENVKGLEEYIYELKREKFETNDDDVVGAIAMHCNPLTLGHMYLIETALKQVDYLYIFILSEDTSEIPFALRKELLLHETSRFQNVKVFNCGEFMASTTVFPEYFSKEKYKVSRIDASKDILTFCQHVAPVLGINKRFVGTENRDFVTRQYNNQLKLILPYYDIEVCEIERKSCEYGHISAYSTRNMIRNNEWYKVKSMVTEFVWNRLKKYYGG